MIATRMTTTTTTTTTKATERSLQRFARSSFAFPFLFCCALLRAAAGGVYHTYGPCITVFPPLSLINGDHKWPTPTLTLTHTHLTAPNTRTHT
jgi:hypothetical protein